MLHSIPYGRQSIDADDVRAVTNALMSDRLTQGPIVCEFEEKIAEYCSAIYAVAVCNATAALHIACRALGLGAGDTLWTSPITFVASANCALYCGAQVDFVDIDPDTFNMDPVSLEKKLKAAKSQGKLPKIVVVVHMGGASCEMQKISQLAKEFGFAIIEDASHAVGGEYQGTKVGSCKFSDLTVFSFHPVKIITTGEGGVITTNRQDLYDRLALLRSHGITRDPEQMEGPSEGAWYYEQTDLGYNYRITDIQAALGRSQLNKLDQFVQLRQEKAAIYHEAFRSVPVGVQSIQGGVLSAYHLYIIQVENRASVFNHLRQAGIEANVHYIPVYFQPFYKKLGFSRGLCPMAERYYERAISLPMYSSLTEIDQARVIAELRSAL